MEQRSWTKNLVKSESIKNSRYITTRKKIYNVRRAATKIGDVELLRVARQAVALGPHVIHLSFRLTPPYLLLRISWHTLPIFNYDKNSSWPHKCHQFSPPLSLELVTGPGAGAGASDGDSESASFKSAYTTRPSDSELPLSLLPSSFSAEAVVARWQRSRPIRAKLSKATLILLRDAMLDMRGYLASSSFVVFQGLVDCFLSL